MSKNWPSSEVFRNSFNDYDNGMSEEILCEYIYPIENKVNEELKVYPEPSIQGGHGGMFIHDESGKYESAYYDYQEWCDTERDLAMISKSPQDFEKEYRWFIQGLDWIELEEEN